MPEDIEINLNAGKVASNRCVLYVRLTGTQAFSLRLKLVVLILRVAALVSPIPFVVEL